MSAQVAMQLMEFAGGDVFARVAQESQHHQQEHGCGLHNAGGPQMQLVAALARAVGARRALDLGSGLGYSTLWIASAIGDDATVLGIDHDPMHTARATEIASAAGYGDRVEFITGEVRDVLPTLREPFDMIHDDAWFAKAPDHLESMLALLRPGGLLTMVNWFLLVDALTGEPRNDWAAFAGPTWAEDTLDYARQLANGTDLRVTWITTPPIAFATKIPR